MRSLRILSMLLLGLIVVSFTQLQAQPDKKKDPQSSFEPRSSPGAGQKFLLGFVGNWDVVKTFHPRKGTPARTTGVCTQTMIHGGRFLQSDFVFGSGDTKTTGQGLIGFETKTGKFTSVWTDSRATRMSFRQSDKPFNGSEIVLFGRMLNEQASGPAKSRTSTKLLEDGAKIIHQQFTLDAEGKERIIMELQMTRRKPK